MSSSAFANQTHRDQLTIGEFGLWPRSFEEWRNRFPNVIYHDKHPLELAPLPGKKQGKLKLTPEVLLVAILDQVATRPSLAQALGFGGRIISQSQYGEWRQQLAVLPLLLFFLALVAQLIRLGVITAMALIVDSSLLSAWRQYDPVPRPA